MRLGVTRAEFDRTLELSFRGVEVVGVGEREPDGDVRFWKRTVERHSAPRHDVCAVQGSSYGGEVVEGHKFVNFGEARVPGRECRVPLDSASIVLLGRLHPDEASTQFGVSAPEVEFPDV